MRTKKIAFSKWATTIMRTSPGSARTFRSRGRCVASHVHFGISKAFGETAEDGDEQIEETGDSRKTFW